MMNTPHRWRFFQTSGLEQVRLESGADLANLEHLDQKLWVALSCPVAGLELDERTLSLVDGDGDGRIRAGELLAAITFCRDRLTNLDGLSSRSPELPVASLDAGKDAGKRVADAVRAILASLGKADATALHIDDAAKATDAFSKQRRNGDGIITAEATPDEALAAAIRDALATVGGEADRSGADGLSQARIDAFFAELDAVDAWVTEGETEREALFPLGDGTAAAAAAVAAIEAKVDDYFTRCRLAEYDEAARGALNPSEGQYASVATGELSAGAGEVSSLPLAHVEPGRPLPLGAGVNPAWRGAVDALAAAVTAILGPQDALTREAWGEVRGRVAAHRAWTGRKPASKAHELGIERVRALRASDAKGGLATLVAEDASAAGTWDMLMEVERLVRYHRDLFDLANNFVSFRHFYAPDAWASFQAGTLFLDSRACDLCIRVADAGKHAALAGLSGCYLAYCDCVRKDGGKMQVVAVFSDGDSDFLMVGRNGVFYDRKGRDWDATITKIVDNPISIRQAFFAPYKRFVRFVEEQVASRAASADSAATAQLKTAAQSTANVDKAPPPASRFDLGSIALIGVAVSGAAGVIGALLQAFFGLGIWMPFGMAGIVLAISGPSMLIAALKLRQRNLGPILDANGWAINGRVRLNIPFGGSLTHLAEYPKGSERGFVDPYQPKKGPWGMIATLVTLLAVVVGSLWLSYHQGWLPGRAESALGLFGVPHHLVVAKQDADAAVVEARVGVTAAQDQLTASSAVLAELVAAGEAEGPRLERARARVSRAESKLDRAQDRLDKVDLRAEAATEALEVAIDAEEARVEASEASETAE